MGVRGAGDRQPAVFPDRGEQAHAHVDIGVRAHEGGLIGGPFEQEHGGRVGVGVLHMNGILEAEELALQAIGHQRALHAHAVQIEVQVGHGVPEVVEGQEFGIFVHLQDVGGGGGALKEVHGAAGNAQRRQRLGIEGAAGVAELFQLVVGQHRPARHGDGYRPELGLRPGAVEAVPAVPVTEHQPVGVVDVDLTVVEVSPSHGVEAVLHDLPVGGVGLVLAPDDVAGHPRAVEDARAEEGLGAAGQEEDLVSHGLADDRKCLSLHLDAVAVGEFHKVTLPVEVAHRGGQEVQFEVGGAELIHHAAEGLAEVIVVGGIPQVEGVVMLPQGNIGHGQVLQLLIEFGLIVQEQGSQPQTEGQPQLADVGRGGGHALGEFLLVGDPLAAEGARSLPAVVDLDEVGSAFAGVHDLHIGGGTDAILIHVSVEAGPGAPAHGEVSRRDAVVEVCHRVGVGLQESVLAVFGPLGHHEALHDVGLPHGQLPPLQLKAEGDGAIPQEHDRPEAVHGAETAEVGTAVGQVLEHCQLGDLASGMVGVGEYPRDVVGMGGVIVEVQGLHGIQELGGEGEGHLQRLGTDACLQGGEGNGMDVAFGGMGDRNTVLDGIGGQNDRVLGEEQTDLHDGLLGGGDRYPLHYTGFYPKSKGVRGKKNKKTSLSRGGRVCGSRTRGRRGAGYPGGRRGDLAGPGHGRFP